MVHDGRPIASFWVLGRISEQKMPADNLQTDTWAAWEWITVSGWALWGGLKGKIASTWCFRTICEVILNFDVAWGWLWSATLPLEGVWVKSKSSMPSSDHPECNNQLFTGLGCFVNTLPCCSLCICWCTNALVSILLVDPFCQRKQAQSPRQVANLHALPTSFL